MPSSIPTTFGESGGCLVSLSDEIEILLTKEELFELSGDARGTQISAAHGNLWVTQQGDPEDYLLHPGENVKITRKGMVLIQGIPEGRARISSAPKFPQENE